jgi:hypothetical protein
MKNKNIETFEMQYLKQSIIVVIQMLNSSYSFESLWPKNYTELEKIRDIEIQIYSQTHAK